MALTVEMESYDKEEFIIRARRQHTDASKVVRELIKKWMLEHPDSPKTKQKPAVE
jgi:nitrogen fixation protein